MIEVICGGMFAGKSELLIHRLNRASYAKKIVVAFKPTIDDRYSKNDIESHSGMKYECRAIKDAIEIKNYLKSNRVDVIGIDEVQFFSENIYEIVSELSLWPDRFEFYIAGLDLDSTGKPFGSIPNLLAIADKVTKVSAVCMKCGKDATRSQRLVSSNEQILVGASDRYEARCIRCWVPK
jgi:thymidine kinase